MHIEDTLLNEYLDSPLSPRERASVQSHLESCEACAARLGALRAVFDKLESLPDTPLNRDLSPAVSAAIRARTQPALPPILRLAFAAQALVALALLTSTGPVFAQYLPQIPIFRFGDLAMTTLARTQNTFAAELRALLVSFQQITTGGLDLAGTVTMPSLSPLGAGVFAVAVSLLWLIGNGFLLRPARLRR